MIYYFYLFRENSLILCANECRDDQAVDWGGYCLVDLRVIIVTKAISCFRFSPTIHLMCDFAKCSVNLYALVIEKYYHSWTSHIPF